MGKALIHYYVLTFLLSIVAFFLSMILVYFLLSFVYIAGRFTFLKDKDDCWLYAKIAGVLVLIAIGLSI
jgi:hypothetical protein